jgi:hypothetical protein
VSDGLAWDDLSVAIKGPDAEIRKADFGGLSICLLRLDQGHDTRPIFRGMPDDLCQIPHWGYIIRGRVRLWTLGDAKTYESGQTFYWPPGHAPEALEDSEYLEISPTDQYDQLLSHIKAG